MIVLGVDPGSHATGYGVIETSPTVRLLDGGVIRTRTDAPLARRLLTIHTDLCEVFDRHRIDGMAVENVFNAKNARSSLILGHARGVILLAGGCGGPGRGRIRAARGEAGADGQRQRGQGTGAFHGDAFAGG